METTFEPPQTTTHTTARPPAPPPPDAPAPAEEDGRRPVTVRLQPRHHDYLLRRAAQHGETPERHLETILRAFHAHHDPGRHGRDTAPRGPGAPAGTGPR